MFNERDAELSRRLAAVYLRQGEDGLKKDGTITEWSRQSWGSGAWAGRRLRLYRTSLTSRINRKQHTNLINHVEANVRGARQITRRRAR